MANIKKKMPAIKICDTSSSNMYVFVCEYVNLKLYKETLKHHNHLYLN